MTRRSRQARAHRADSSSATSRSSCRHPAGVLVAVDLARDAGARELTLRVLAANSHARRLYESNGCTIERVLRGEFHLEGRDVNDVLMARQLDGPS